MTFALRTLLAAHEMGMHLERWQIRWYLHISLIGLDGLPPLPRSHR